MSSENPIPRVPDVTDPQPSTPLTEDFETGTANDPEPAGATEPATLTVDGRSVTVDPGATLLDALEEAGVADDVPALCHDEHSDEIGPRSTCRTCVVETDSHGLVPSCSFPAEEGLTVHTDTPDASETRDVNLDLVLSNHNLRCTTCGKNGRCELQDTAIEQEVEDPRYGVFDDREAYEPLDDTSPFIQIDRNKCILCNRCVEACNDVQVEGVLRLEGSGSDTRIAFQNDSEAMAASSCVSCGHCATVCPTGSITETGLADSATLPIPGFTQKNSIGTTVDYDPDDAGAPATASGAATAAEGGDDEELSGVAGLMARAKRSATDLGERAFLEAEHAAEHVASSVLSEGQMFDIAEAVSDHRLADVEATETTCGYCSVGCRFDVYTDDEEVLGVRPIDADHAPANDGFSTCVKGKFGYDFVDSDGRLEQPLVRDDGELREASWEEALARVVEGLSSIREAAGPDAISCFASSKCTNEENYLMQKFARQVLGTKNIDNCARLCHSSTVAALKQTVGYGAMTNRIEDVANTDCYLITGSNTTESHPVLATRIKQNVRDGAELLVFDPRKVGIADHADQYTRVEPGHDVAWINGLTRYIIEHDLHDEAFIEEWTTNFEELKRKVEPFTPAEVERLCGVAPDDLATAAETIATAETCVFGWAMGMTQHSHGTQNVLALANLALVTGHLGKPNAGLSPFRGHNNVQGGGGDMGTLPDSLPGYQPVDDPDVLEAFETVWGERPPSEPGLTVPEAFTEAHEGNVRGMYVMGENPALSEPALGHAEDALEELDFLVVQDVFLTETAEHADVVLPAASFAEKAGTFTNTERRVQLVNQALSPPGAARQDWAILQALATRFGYEWDYESPAEIMDEINELVPIYGGISHERLESEGGLQWPCRDAADPGTPYLYADGFNFEDGKARFVPADLGQPGELPDEEYPLTLTTGRVLYHFHTGTLTRKVDGIMSHVGESFVEINPETADRLGVSDGETVTVESRRGAITVRAQLTDRVDPGVVFIPMHFAAGAANELTGESFDPISGIPEYKVSSVRIPSEGELDIDGSSSAPVAADDD
ncbi:formate dehydrogenase subunit alpha [Natronolimnohabitans sp. A-GB9]|uniref:formate dehydrogenase subunit alpha n=1 Tax=Natronolimnohabitans sp. A-GB9 TaxID=3069757 RepID=UPI0027B69EFD|nr:formate dehydrogenase subunit alpha [Natronolimnohabitans sp. A-GB9]MDQ2051738.1 formate dehydrogenase subunit alpha [Natronolimnohabitans sp. A-GB9]